jgi:hypothetical protein
MAEHAELPNVAAILAPLLQRVPAEQIPFLLAIAERLAATRYRQWAAQVGVPARREGLLACADREEEIARRIEALTPDVGVVQRDLLAANPDLEEINRSVFANRPLAQQFAIQAQGERLGAATWRSFAQRQESDSARATFLACAELEEASAAFLDLLLAES